jgi:hypothetical protein
MTGLMMRASIDSVSGEVYVPARWFAADGSLRVCEETTLPAVGVLRAATGIGGQDYGLIDLDDDVRVQVRLVGTEHEVGAAYAARHRSAEATSEPADIGDIEFCRALVGDDDPHRGLRKLESRGRE